MLQLIGFFLATLAALHVLRLLPGVGGIFQVPFVGFLLASVLVSALFSFLAREGYERARQRRLEQQFRGVETPHNQGKLGALLLARGRAKAALPHLERAVAGDPEAREARWNLAQALAACGQDARALAALAPLLRAEEGFAYGDALLLAARCERRMGQSQQALERLAAHERQCGAQPAALYERAHALRALGRKAEARATFRSVQAASSAQVKWKRNADRRIEWLARVWSWIL